MIQEPTHRAPVVLGRDEPLRLTDGALRLIIMSVVILVAGAIMALALMPAARAAGKATMRFTGQFTDLTPGDLQFPRFPERSTILAKDGSLLATFYLDENRKVVRLDEVAPIVRKAVIAIEDARFYDHGALDVEGILRAAFANLKAGEVTEGGSTITQQLVKTVFTTGERTFARKLEEARLAFRLEREYTKDQILELYLNEVYMGRSVNGVQAAAEFYFAKNASELNLAEAATLAGLIAAPETFNPITQPEAALGRRNLVLDRMVATGAIPAAEAQEARDSEIQLSDRLRATNKPGTAPYFVEYIRNQMLHDPAFAAFGKALAPEQTCEVDDATKLPARCRALYQGGLRIQTTLDPSWLRFAKDAVKGQLPLPEDPESAVITIDATTGAIRTLLGGTDFKKQKFDLATQGLRQPGSAFKAFTLVAALEQGIPAGKVYNMKSPISIGGICSGPDGAWTPGNAEGGSEDRFINMAEATADSVNVYFAQLIRDTGPGNVQDAAERMGIKSPLEAICSLTLGGKEVTPLDMASAYATLANDGTHCEPFAIGKVFGPGGEDVYEHQADCTQVVDPQIVATVDSFLQGVVQHGTGTAASLGARPVAGKTGTTQDHADGWFVGILNKQLSTAVWVGDIEGRIPISNRGSIAGPLFGGNKPASIWHDYMIRASEGLPVTSFPAPPPLPSAEVPDVVGETQAEAERILGEANFTAVVEEKPALAPAGVVVQQDPPGGASVTAGSAVTIWVSNGTTPNRVVPNVVGMTQEGATERLENANFVVAVSFVDVDEIEEDGIVRNQIPQGGTKQLEGSTVRIVVGNYVKPSPSPSASPSPTPTCTPNGTPRCDHPSHPGGATGGSPAAGVAGILIPLALAARARRRSTRRSPSR
ncbi:MAG: transglycosylase domain-containing protein [Actinobacteria bacterium]|nr:transglycosylase domain-containing protein [Actinomycetota bacterium]